MLYYIHQFIICTLFLFSTSCGNQPSQQTSGKDEEVYEDGKNQHLSCANNVVDNTIEPPAFKKVQKTGGVLQVGLTLKFEGEEKLRAKYGATFKALQSQANKIGIGKDRTTIVEIRIVNVAAFQKVEPKLSSDFSNQKEAYLLKVRDDKITLNALGEQGVVNGLSSLEYLFRRFNGKIEQGNILDYPNLEMRAAQLVLRAITPAVAKAGIDRLRTTHYNVVLLSISNNVQFKSLGKLANNCAWTIDEFLEVVKYARESGMEVVPELRFLSHQGKDFLVTGAYPELMYNEKTYNPKNEKVYKIVFGYIDEVINLLHPSAIHIGHDEVYGISGKNAGSNDALPPALFKEDLLKIYNYLKKQNVKTWMWGDMLITPSEFPNMHPGSINGNKEYAKLRKEIPKDILICDWHYRDESNDKFPSLKAFADEGFNVIGATFRDPQVTRQFASYAAGLKNPNVKGMMATTWTFLRKGAVGGRQTDNYKAFDALIHYSAEDFWNAK